LVTYWSLCLYVYLLARFGVIIITLVGRFFKISSFLGADVSDCVILLFFLCVRLY
jgi:hypothetical protein